jgi:[acyl-carrier-protein] S-malonyltransferase
VTGADTRRQHHDSSPAPAVHDDDTGQTSADAKVGTMNPDGEYLVATERVVVSPAAGVFVPAEPVATELEVGSTLGFIRTGVDDVPVRSPFGGQLVSIVATSGERLALHQRVAWLRAC